jgi:site-specific DNA-cytosine methylase
MRALELLNLRPAMYISIEKDPQSKEVVERAWPDVISLGSFEGLDPHELEELLSRKSLRKGLIIGGAPCQGFTRLSTQRQGFDDPRSSGIGKFAQLVTMLGDLAPHIEWHAMLENVASMSEEDRGTITGIMDKAFPGQGRVEPYMIDAAILGPVSRPRLYWTSFGLGDAVIHPSGVPVFGQQELHFGRERRMRGKAPGATQGYTLVTNPSKERIPVEQFLDPGVTKCGAAREPFPTAVRWIPRDSPPDYPHAIEDCDPETLDKWRERERERESKYAMAPYQFKRKLGVRDADGKERPPNAVEKERLHG